MLSRDVKFLLSRPKEQEVLKLPDIAIFTKRDVVASNIFHVDCI
jgi:hypothetical protein